MANSAPTGTNGATSNLPLIVRTLRTCSIGPFPHNHESWKFGLANPRETVATKASCRPIAAKRPSPANISGCGVPSATVGRHPEI